ncbi:MAG: LysM peptidoglycan-binding domain-containing protein [Acetobacter sp.]|nr:LysM peptidoglycan-binding domain-containing protein [Bacteroides sp.]MCM1341727.1 LysM peptidoglycan-binding domain-containing protein [Acetobacter sp.]MCM1432334.1 LysM peptidoglycan-binding domain-containing protein [Clostridiales bacterium]
MTAVQEEIGIKLTYRDYVFPTNPKKIEMFSDTKINTTSIFNENSVVENISVNPVIIRCSGELFGDDGRECCDKMQLYLKEQISGWLFAPEISPIEAFLTAFSYSRSASNNSISYEIVFTERCNDKKIRADIEYTVCKNSENMFEIANIYGVSVEQLMRLNNIASPFELKKGDRVVLR